MLQLSSYLDPGFGVFASTGQECPVFFFGSSCDYSNRSIISLNDNIVHGATCAYDFAFIYFLGKLKGYFCLSDSVFWHMVVF